MSQRWPRLQVELESLIARNDDLPSTLVDRETVFLNTKVGSYVAFDDLRRRCHVVRYEDLWHHAEDALGEVVRSCGSPTAGGAFFRGEEVGSWRQELPAELAWQVVEARPETMSRFGYLDDAVTPRYGPWIRTR